MIMTVHLIDTNRGPVVVLPVTRQGSMDWSTVGNKTLVYRTIADTSNIKAVWVATKRIYVRDEASA